MTVQTLSHFTRGPSRVRELALHLPGWAWLALGSAITLLTGPRWGIAALAWFAPVPYLVYARSATGWQKWSALGGVLLLAHVLQVVPMATPPVPVIAIIGFGPPLALLRFSAILLSEVLRRRLGETAGVLGYVAASVFFDWLGYGVSELGAWMATANSQVDWLAFMQLASLAGLAGLGALMAWVAASVARLIAAEKRQGQLGPALAPALAVTLGLGFGSLRQAQPLPESSVLVAALATDVGPDEAGLPDAETLAKNTDDLFERTGVAAARGARLVVWNEIATLVEPKDEPAFVERGRATARAHRIDLVLGYGVLESSTPVLFDNKYLFISERGEILDEYQKHHPVPGEPSVRGSGPLKVLSRPYGKVGGAICYDYDFPAMAREHAESGAELVVVPSSDWRGIDPIHTLMARTRAIEGGFSLLRATRWAPSGAFDAHGQIRAWMPASNAGDSVMLAEVPVGRTPTLATRIGDAPVGVAGVVLVGLAGLAFRRRREAPSEPSVDRAGQA